MTTDILNLAGGWGHDAGRLAGAAGFREADTDVLQQTEPHLEPTSDPAAGPVIELRDVAKVYGSGSTEVRALAGVSLRIDRGEYVTSMGPSDSGKSTLMHILGCLDIATSGQSMSPTSSPRRH